MLVKVMTLPVMTSVMLILYCVMTPFWPPAGGGDHEMLMDEELIGASLTFCGGLEGAGENSKEISITLEQKSKI